MNLLRLFRIVRRKPVPLVIVVCNLLLLFYIYHYLTKEKKTKISDVSPKSFFSDVQHTTKRDAQKVTEEPSIIESGRSGGGRSFVIDYSNNQFLKDGKPFRYVSGSLHYFRVPRAYWRDRLRKMRAAGLNAISMYVEWSVHEPKRGRYLFTGEQDLEYFLQLTIEEDLLVLFRPGPYICAERDLGGFPSWLFNINPNMKLRTSDELYEREVVRWFEVLMPKMKKFLYGNGGNIIMVQVENEYGSFSACDLKYMEWLRDLFYKYVGNAAVLYTTDGSYNFFLRCGTVPGVYATVDFGTQADVNNSFNAMRLYQPRGPLVNSEFYPGWLSHWDEKFATVATSDILKMTATLLAMNASFNFYMFHGGTNFGFTAGANSNKGLDYQPQLTSYDYDAPLDEAGDPTDKYFAIRNLISKHLTMPNIDPPISRPKGDYGPVILRPMASLFNTSVNPDSKFILSEDVITFEKINQAYGFMLYETIVPDNVPDPAVLNITDLRDRAIVYLDQIPAGVLSRSRGIFKIPLLAFPGQKLSILVENQGRINYGDALYDLKGILSAPRLSSYTLHKWNITSFPFSDITWLFNLNPSTAPITPPAFYKGEITLPEEMGVLPLDSYIDMSGWGKGVLFVNDFNLGRYWPGTGPQVTLYVPGCYLRPYPQVNNVTMFELAHAPSNLLIRFVTEPLLNITPPLTLYSS